MECIKTAEESADFRLLADNLAVCVDLLGREDGEPEPTLFVSFAAGESWQEILNAVEELALECGVRRIQFRSSAEPKVWCKMVPEDVRRARRFRVAEYIYEWWVPDGQEEEETED